jgi:hypothetical protein
MRSLLGKAEGAQNLDGNRLEGSLLRPLDKKLKAALRGHQGVRTPTFRDRRLFWRAIAHWQRWQEVIFGPRLTPGPGASTIFGTQYLTSGTKHNGALADVACLITAMRNKD